MVGTSSAQQVRRLAKWISQPMDEELLSVVEDCLAPVLDRGWVNGRPENQHSEEQP